MTGMPITSHGGFQHDDPLHFAIPLLMVQMVFVLAVTRVLGFFLQYLRQPRVVAEIIGGILMGPSAFGRSKTYLNGLFPGQSLTVLETVANFGLIFFLFIVGLELDLGEVYKSGTQAMVIALAGIFTPFGTGVGVSFVLRATINKGVKPLAFIIFMGVAMSITAFPVLARILAERKLLTTEVGQIAMAAAAVNDVIAWILLALAIALSGGGKPTVAVWVLLTGIAYLIVMFWPVKKFMRWVSNRVAESEHVKEIYVAITFTGVLVSAFLTDAIGIHSIFGSFVFGLVIPKDAPLAKIIIEKTEDLIMVLLLPLYFVSSGLKTNIQAIHGGRSAGLTILVITCACAGKVLGTVIPGRLYGMTYRKGFMLGFLMNTKGLVELIVLNIGKERGVLNDETFAIMVIMALVTTFITTPVVMSLHEPPKPLVSYVLKTMESIQPKDELSIVTCVHGVYNAPGVISVVDLARGRGKPKMRLYVLHLVELSERPSAIVMVRQARRDGRPFFNRRIRSKNPAGESHLYVAFETFGQLSEVKVRAMTAISNFDNMHEDICLTASQKRAALLLLPFHKLHMHDGSLETPNAGFQMVNKNVLKHSPCSVGIFVDRRFLEQYNGPVQVPSIDKKPQSHTTAVLFFGGPDDREALALGCRMALHPGALVKVVRFVVRTDNDNNNNELETHRTSLVLSPGRKSFKKLLREAEYPKYDPDLERINFAAEELADADALKKMREENGDLKENLLYEELPIHDPIDTALEYMKQSDAHLVLVGKGRRPSRPLAMLHGLELEYEELGPLGSVLSTSDSDLKASVLVVQQYLSDMDANGPPPSPLPTTPSPDPLPPSPPTPTTPTTLNEPPLPEP